jgi:hypothetical protein
MDLYQKNPLTLKKLLAKRQNPCTQVFKSSNSTISSEPVIPTYLQQKASSNLPTMSSPQIISTPLATIILTSNDSTSSCNNQSTCLSQEEVQTSEDDGDARPHGQEKPRKKIKKNSDIAAEEEERDERDSTSCETISDPGNGIPEDFLSPPLSGQSSMESKVGEFKLDESYIQSSSDESTVLKQAKQLADQHEGEFFVTGSCLLNSKLKFKCKFNHQFAINVDEFKTKWCQRCDELLKDFNDFATKFGGRCLNQEYEEYISFECNKGHSWKLNHKNAKKRWCLDCVKDEKAELRKKCEEERMLRQKKEEEAQKKMFEDAKRRAMEEQYSQNYYAKPAMNSGYPSQSVLEYFQRMDYEIEKLAQKYSREFMSRKEFTGDVTYQQILQVYKILIMPEDVLQNYMYNLNGEMLKQEFRRFAKIIHPDKNKHPQAGPAFQKIYKVYEAALARVEAAQKI